MTERDELRDLAADPATPWTTLHRIAQERPDLRGTLAANPATYPDLLAWLATLGDPQVDAALAERASSAAPPPPGPYDPTAAGDLTGPDDARTDVLPATPTERTAELPATPGDTSGGRAPTDRPTGADAPTIPPGATAPPPRRRSIMPAGRAGGAGPGAGTPDAAPTSSTSDAPTGAADPAGRRPGWVVLVLAAAVVVAGAIWALDLTGRDAPGGGDPPTAQDTTGERPVTEERPAPEGAVAMDGFTSPSANISCVLGEDSASCTIEERAFPDPAGCTDGPVTVLVPPTGEPVIDCEAPAADGVGTLGYGEAATSGVFACTSEEDGVTCWSTLTGRGFSLARAGVETF